jgi:hypothetical protein
MGSRAGSSRTATTVGMPQPRSQADERSGVFKAEALAELDEAHAF